MKRLVLTAALLPSVALQGCVGITRETRTERGPALRTSEREVPAGEGGVLARVEPKWPELVLRFERFDLCRKERVEEAVEDRITESQSRAAGPAFALGVTGTLIGAGLLAFRKTFSETPGSGRIDLEGRYEPAPRQVATGWGVVALGAGVPALATGLVGLAQTGQKVESRRVEHVASSLEGPCNAQPADGEVLLERATGPGSVTARTEGGRVTLDATKLRELRIASVHLDGQPVLLPEEEAVTLGAFLSCSEALPLPEGAEGDAALTAMGEAALVDRYNAARRCAVVSPEVANDAVKRLEGEIHRRRGSAPSRLSAAPRSFDEAVAAWPPSLRLEAGSGDLDQLAVVEKHVGRTAYVRGTLERRVEADVLLVAVAGHRLWAFIPPDAAFGADFTEGSEVEVLGVVVGRQAVGRVEAPLLRVMWARPAVSQSPAPAKPEGS